MAAKKVGQVGVATAGGVITGPGAPTVKARGIKVVVLGDHVAPHGTGPHAGAVMVQASMSVFAEGIPVCREGDAASCGHTLTNCVPDVKAG